ncbi:hypothetical protein [Acinetobacter rudis]|uniref:Carbohydrate-binding protein n=1 Tax=Acinetobacter rudis CIP 110305 TaxID=421052 RepID=S3NHI6_9GAMM|nr:hypothetical protein [Acinetobacter rudis]EPF73789.1 hypothetical protein F945_01948 [Acinetobacter rudis CIP 110305]
MAKTTIIKNNFSSGELAPVLSTRTDIAQYGNGAKQLKNVIPLVEGGVRKRPGTFYRSFMSGARRLITFATTSNNSFLLILKPKEIIIYDPRLNSVIATLETPYDLADIQDVQYIHTRYVMYLTHQNYPVQILQCSEDFTNWKFSEMKFDVPPMDEVITTPNVALTPSGKDVGETISLSASSYPNWNATTTYFQDDRVIHLNSFWKALRDNINSQPTIENNDWESVTGDQVDAFKPEHVGAIVHINGGYVRVTEFISFWQLKGEVIVELTAVVQAIAKSWVLKTAAFNAELGYPKCVSYFKQRLVFGNTKKFPNKIWFSAVGIPTNFLETADDGDAFSVVSSSDQSHSIVFLVPTKGLVALTSGAEFLIGSDGVLTPTTVQIDEHTSYGAYPLTRPCRVGNELLFVQRGGERLRALSYRYEVDGLVSPEVSAISRHIGKDHGGILEATYQQEPESLVWLVLGDGKVASITFNREQEVVAWAQHDFGSKVISICSVPSELGSDLCFMLIQRGDDISLEQISFEAHTDSERTINLDAGQGSFDANQVSFLTDLAIYKKDGQSQYELQFQRDDDQVKILNTPTNITQSIKVGQNFEITVKLFPPELSQVPGTSLQHKSKVNLIAFYFNNTQAPIFNGQILNLYKFDNNVFGAPKPFTGRHLEQEGDWSDLYDIELVITHNKPLPFHMQAIAIDISINER